MLSLLLLTDDALLSLDEVLLWFEALAASVPGGGGGDCCSEASSSSSTLDNSVELSLLLAEVEPLDATSLAGRPDRRLMFSSWK